MKLIKKKEEPKFKAISIPLNKKPASSKDSGNSIGFGMTLDMPRVATKAEKQWLNNWYNNKITKQRISDNGGTDDALDRGLFLNKNSRSYQDEGWFAPEGIYDPKNRITVYGDLMPKKNIMIHEENHNFQKLHKQLFKGNERLDTYKYDDALKYARDPTEVHSRMMEVRYNLKKNPGELITMPEYLKAKDELNKSGNIFKTRAFEDYEDSDMVNWLNTIASTNKPNRFV